ncbi:hypothetical protein V2J09_020100 [Rumex salicifolius]
MAISLSNSTISFTSTTHNPNGPELAFPVTLSTGKRPSMAVKRAVLIRPTEPLTSIDVNYVEKLRLDQKEREQVAECWEEIHGQNDWAGLLDPMDPILRSELIRYGEMAQACYDAFDYDKYSINCGSCKYPKKKFFKNLGVGQGYDVSRYLFATSNINLPKFFKKSLWPEVWSKNANWIGYVAVSDDETSTRLGRRDIVIAWRGTVTRLEWIHDLMDILQPVSSDKIPCHDNSVKVESGFVSLYTDKDESCSYCKLSAREQVLAEVSCLMEKYSDEKLSISVTGHSLGSALAVLSAFDVAEIGVNIRADGRAVPVGVFSFSGPRVGNRRFKERLENTLGVKVLRVHNVNDVVPKAPGVLVNEHVPSGLVRFAEAFPWSYSHVGTELALDHRNSPFLKESSDRICAHNLEALLHLIDGYRGTGEHFRLASKRDIALVNKDCDFLKSHHKIPPCWRQHENKGMVKSKDGRWIQPERPLIEDLHDDLHRHLTQLGLPIPSNPE